MGPLEGGLSPRVRVTAGAGVAPRVGRGLAKILHTMGVSHTRQLIFT